MIDNFDKNNSEQPTLQEINSCKTQNCYLLPDAQLTVHNFQPAISNEAKESGIGER